MSEQIPHCEQCQQRYNFFRRRKLCDACGQIFCSKCAPRSSNSIRVCPICLIIKNERTTREQLTSIRVKHLRAYLIHSKLISINHLETCLEKQDLINLIQSKRRSTTENSYIFVERPNIQPSNNTTTTTTNVNQEVLPPSDTSPIPPNEPRTETISTDSTPPPVPNDPPPSAPAPAPPPPSVVQTNPIRTTLDDLSSIESIQDLTIRQLQDILAHNFVSTRGCVEKQELIHKVELLYRDKQQQQQQTELNTNSANGPSDENLCKICMDASIDCVFLDCGHLCTCVQCGKRLSECPLCRSYIIRVVRVFKS